MIDSVRVHERNRRAFSQDTGSAIPVEVVSFDILGNQPTVDVKPIQKAKQFNIGGGTQNVEPLIAYKIPYMLPMAGTFKFFIPPEAGMKGLLINTNTEVGEVDAGSIQTSRLKDRFSGVFIPTGFEKFEGPEDWAQFGYGKSVIGLSKESIFFGSGEGFMSISGGNFDAENNNISIVRALKQISDHIAYLEDLVHVDGGEHGGRKDRYVDDFIEGSRPSVFDEGMT